MIFCGVLAIYIWDLTKSFSIVSTNGISFCFLQAHSCSKGFGEHTALLAFQCVCGTSPNV